MLNDLVTGLYSTGYGFGNIIVYLAGHVGRKAVLKLKCKDCTDVWNKHDEASRSALYTFINNKQYDD